MNKSPIISVIIPCYNSSDFILETLNSLYEQSFSNFEIIAINDGSTDNTLELLYDYQKKDSRMKIIDQDNSYYIIARNNGINIAKGKYLVCLDSDDKLHTDYLLRCYKIAESNPDLSIVYADAEFFDKQSGKINLPEFNIKNFLINNGIYVTALIRKSHFDLVGGFDTSLTCYEDWDLFISLVKNCGKVYKIPEVLFFYRKRSNNTSVTDTSTKEKRSENLFKIYSKHKDFYMKNEIFFEDLFYSINDKKYWRNKYYNLFPVKVFYRFFKPRKYKLIYSDLLK